MNNWTTEEENKLRELCLEGKNSFASMAKIFPLRTKMSLAARCYTLKLKNSYRKPPKYTMNNDYFKEYNLDNCYWAGMLAADGHIGYKKNSPHVKWGCAAKDLCHMELFKKMINSDHPIKFQYKKCNISTADKEKLHKYNYMHFWSVRQWVSDIKRNFGFDENKTFRSEMPKMTELKHKLAFIKGFIDGDGTITIATKGKSMCISFCGCNQELLLWVKGIFDSLNLPTLAHRDSLVHKRKTTKENCYYWSKAGLTAAIMYEILRKVATPELARKWENPEITEIVNYWKSRTDVWPVSTFFNQFIFSL